MPKKPEAADQDPYHARESRKYEHPIPSREFILDLLRKRSRPQNRDELIKALGLEGPEAVEGLRRRLKAMERDGQVVRNRRGGYVIVDNEDLIRGRVNGAPDGSGYVHPDGAGERVYLAPRQMRCLLHGDRVVVRLIGMDQQGRPEGELVEILKRHNHQIAGRFYLESGVGFVVPSNKRVHHDVIVPAAEQAGATDGSLVVAELLRQPSERRQPIGRIIEVLGEHIEAGQEIAVAERVHGIPTLWPEAVEREIAHLGREVPEQAKQGRVDLRQLPLVTIDGPDARDFDDAVYCERTPKGWKLIVAIADVSHYVRPRSALDDEAQNRGNSVYFPRAVVPMLPEVLSNGLCSLNPEVDRLCMCAEMQIGGDGKLRRSKFYRGVMNSQARLTYDEAAAIVVDQDAALRKKRAHVLENLDNLYGVYQSLRKARERRGAIDFETNESALVFDEHGRIESIRPTERNDAHKLIEECMVTANVAAAQFLLKHKMPALYRDHETPDEEKVEGLRQFLNQLGLGLPGGDTPEPSDYSRLLEQVGDRPDKHLIQTVMLRSLKAADYRPENVGHFGLALEAYAHFTSPIRRYPDLVVHRAIGHILDGGNAGSYETSRDQMIVLGEHCSMTERRADEATRDATMTLKCEFMNDKIGEEFDGIISGVTSFGLFVQLTEVFVDGLIHISNLGDDYYHFDPIGHRLVGERAGKEFRLTDPLRVRVVRVDKDERQIDFELVAHEGRGRGPRIERGKGKKDDSRRGPRRRGGGRRRS